MDDTDVAALYLREKSIVRLCDIVRVHCVSELWQCFESAHIFSALRVQASAARYNQSAKSRRINCACLAKKRKYSLFDYILSSLNHCLFDDSMIPSSAAGCILYTQLHSISLLDNVA